MNNEEIQSLVEQLKAQGLDDEKILNVFYETFKQGKMDRKDLETLASSLGYELDDDFKNDPTPDPIENAGEADAGESDVDNLSKEDLEEAKENPEAVMGEEPEEKEEEDNSDSDSEDSEDEEWEKAQKMFKI